MGKKRCRAKKTSKGIHSAVGKSCRPTHSYADKMLNKLAAWKKGQNPWITVPKEHLMVRVRANSIWGDPRRKYSIFKKDDSDD